MAGEYLLGDSDVESRRLEAQASLWDPVSLALFDRLGIAPGQRVLELGPGTGTLNMELRRRVQGAVDVVDQSPQYLGRVQERWRGDGFGAGRVWNTQVLDADLPDDAYDLIFARWVFLFLRDPAAHLRTLTRALKPGGRLAVQDYYRNTFVLVPTPPDWQAIVDADLEFFAASGSDPNIGAHLPLLFEDSGLDLVDMVPHTKWGHPGSPVWTWLTTYFLGVLDTYTTLGPLSPDAASRIRTAWQAAEQHPQSVLIGPTVLDVVGRKRA